MKGFRCWFSVSRQNKGGKPNSRPSLLSTTSFPNQVSYNNVSVAIVQLVVVSENVWTIAVTENMVIYEEKGTRLWIGYPLDVGQSHTGGLYRSKKVYGSIPSVSKSKIV